MRAGFFVGTLFGLGLAKMARKHRRHRNGRCGNEHRRHRRHRRGEWNWRGPRRFMMHRLFDRLETTPEQERVIQEAVEEIQNSLHGMKGEFGRMREDIASAFTQETFNEESLKDSFGRQDEKLASLRQSLTDSFAKIHETLNPRQRSVLADLLRYGPRGFGRPFGPVEYF